MGLLRHPCLCVVESFVVGLVVVGSPLAAQERAGPAVIEINLQQALALARTHAPAALAAHSRVAEADGRVIEASVRFVDNPSVEFGGGPRVGPSETNTDFEVGVSQSFELGGQRRARIDAATAELDAVSADAGEGLRSALRQVAATFLRARHWEERRRIAADIEQLSSEFARIASMRFEAGDVGILDVKLSKVAWARAAADVRGLEAARDAALGELLAAIGLGAETRVQVTGDLLERRRYERDALLARAASRSDLQRIEASLRAAEAELRLAAAGGRPELGVGVHYAREEQADIFGAGISLSLPVFSRGTGRQVAARARADGLRVERTVARNAADLQIRVAHGVYQVLVDAVDGFERDGLAELEEIAALARASYEAGAAGLGELLTVRRELIEARVAYADLLLEAALAGVELETAAGLL